MSNELESDSAMVMNLESFGVYGAGYDETETEPVYYRSAAESEHWQTHVTRCGQLYRESPSPFRPTPNVTGSDVTGRDLEQMPLSTPRTDQDHKFSPQATRCTLWSI
jgi:hypothetical protein